MKKLFVLVFALVAVISMIFAINVSAADATKVSSADIAQTYEADGTAIAENGWNGGSYCKHAFDGNTTGYLYQNTAGRYVIIDLNAKLEGGYQVTEVKVYHAGNTKYSLYYTTDGATWTPIAEGASGTATYAVNAVATQVKYVFDTTIGWTPSLAEIEVYGIDPAELECFHTNLTEEGWVAVEGSATCTTIGNQTQTCPDCGEVFIRESATVPALGHDLSSVVNREGTATEYGSGSITCSRCDYGFTFDGEVNFTSGNNFAYGETPNFMSIIVSSIGHQSWGNNAERLTNGSLETGWGHDWYAATNDDENEYVMLNFKYAIDLTKLELRLLNDKNATLRISALNEETGEYEVVKEIYPTYDETLGNFAAYNLTVSMLGVTTSSVKIQVISSSVWQNGFHYDCMTVGEIAVYGVAQGCGLKAAEHVHDYSEFVEYKVEPTCQAAGIATYKCVCNDQVSVEVEASEEYHAYESFITTYPTCVSVGYEKFTCTICADEYTVEIVADLENDDVHNYWPDYATKKDATCIEGGYEKLVCQNCQKEKEVTTEPDTEYGHDWIVNEETLVEATCTTDGYKEQTCALCETYQEVVLDKTIFGSHDYVVDEETKVIANCQNNGYAKYTCSVCGDVKEETTEAGPWLHDYVTSANGLFKACSVCGDSMIYGTIDGGNEDAVAEYSVYLYNGNILNIYYTTDYAVFDEYYNYTMELAEDGTYCITISECYNGADTFKLANTTATFAIMENGGVLTLTNTEGAVYTFDNIPDVVEEDDNSLLNGTYEFAPEEGQSFVVTFEDGVIYVVEDTFALGLPESFNYVYNSETGAITTDGIGYFYVDVTTGDIYYGRGWLLSPVVDEPDEPDVPEVNYGDWFTTMIVMTENGYGFNNLADTEHAYYTFTAEEAGAYSFYLPAGLGFWSKAEYDAWHDPEIDFMNNAEGVYVTIELAAGESVEFSVGATEEKGWEVAVYYLAPEHTCEFNVVERVESTCTTEGYVTYECSCGATYTETLELAAHTEAIIPEILPTPSTTGFTSGIECSVCDAVIKAPVEVVITETKINGEFRLATVNLSLQENISINYWAEINEANYTDAYVVFVFRGTETVVFDYKMHATNGRRGYNFDGTFPQFMNEQLETYLYAKTGEGTYAMQPHTYSVKQYCVSQFKKGDATLKTVISDVLTLGAMTQLYTGYKTSELITDIVKNEDGLTLTPTAYTSIPAECDKQLITGDKDAGTDWKTLSLLMGSSTQIKFTFVCDDINNTTIKVNFAGEEKIFTSEEFQYDAESARYFIVIDYVQSYMYDEVVTATFVRDGVEFGRVVNYSINTYLYKNAEKTSQTEVARNLMKALYVYGVSICNYFN